MLVWFFGSKAGRRYVRHYFAAAGVLMGIGLSVAAFMELYFGYLVSQEHFGQLQKQMAVAGALKIEQFVQEIERDIRAATKTREIVRDGLSAEYKWELRRLLVNTPAITKAIAFDLEGRERASAQRFWTSIPLTPTATVLRHGETFFGPARFTDDGPYMELAVPIERLPGEIIGLLHAQVDLKYVWEVISNIQVGEAGKAYLVASSGALIAHPDISLVLQNRNLTGIPHLEDAFNASGKLEKSGAAISRNLLGEEVYLAYAPIPRLEWAVFTERPIDEIYGPMFASMLRSSGVLVAGIGLALWAILFVRRRIVRPVETLRQGAEAIRKGELGARVELETGDDFEVLSDEFNQMAASLEEAYTDLERKVVQRTEELSAANSKLADASEQKSQFLANVNHELRTPLTAIIGYARLLRRETEGQISELQRENLEDLVQNAERLLHMINSLLDLSKIEAGRMEVRRQAVWVDELIGWAGNTIAPMLDHARVKLVRDIPADIPAFSSDPDLLRQIILNLLANAARFTDDGEIRISALRQHGVLRLSVSDTGIGIRQEEVDEIFEEFRRGEMSKSRNHAGTGLGLAIVKRFVTLLGGSVTVASEIGKGSTFTVTLPAQLVPEEHRP